MGVNGLARPPHSLLHLCAQAGNQGGWPVAPPSTLTRTWPPNRKTLSPTAVNVAAERGSTLHLRRGWPQRAPHGVGWACVMRHARLLTCAPPKWLARSPNSRQPPADSPWRQ
jgi:hypothetical protein